MHRYPNVYSRLQQWRADDIAALGSIKVYPNPAASELFVGMSMQQSADVQLSLYSVTGALVYEQNLNHQQTQIISIPVGELPQGIYSLHITAPGETKTTKVVVQH
jgi:hypothetical protein